MLRPVALLSLLATTWSFSPVQNHSPRSSTHLYSIPDPIDVLTSGLASVARLPAGVTVEKPVDAPEIRVLQLYDVESSPACRKVRERLTELDLSVQLVIPACRNSRVFTDSTYYYSLPVGAEIPRMVIRESNSEETLLSGVEEILSYLDDNFGSTDDEIEEEIAVQALKLFKEVTAYVATGLRIGRGRSVSPAAKVDEKIEKPLILYSYEGNQFCRLVREVLTELDIPYELKSAGKLSPRRDELALVTGGSTQCPFLVDPNTGTSMAESKDIVRYLYQTYAKWTPPNEVLQWASKYVLPLAKPVFKLLTPLQAGSNDDPERSTRIAAAKKEIEKLTTDYPVVVFTYDLSPFSSETKALLDNLDIDFKEYSLGLEWLPGLLKEPEKRAALLELTGQSSLPHIFIGGKSIGGLYSGTPGLLPGLEQGVILDMVAEAKASPSDKIELDASEVGAFE